MRVKFDILAETLVRLTRGFANAVRKDEVQLLQWLFDIKQDDIDSGKPLHDLDTMKAVRRTQRILKLSASNCSPFAVVAVLGLLDMWPSGSGEERLPRDASEAFASHEISMGSFFRVLCNEHKENWDPEDTQLALFVFAIKTCHLGLARPRFTDICVPNPRSYFTFVREACVQELRTKYAKTTAKVTDANRRRLNRLHNQRSAAETFREFHKVAKIFSAQEVAELEKNRERHSPDQIPFTLLSNGLLAHHCCYPDCPQYLEPCVTDTDVAALRAGKMRRNGMRRHLEVNKRIGNYIPGFHAAAAKFIPRCGGNYDAFVRLMTDHFQNSRGLRDIFNSCTEVYSHLETTWRLSRMMTKT
jgi:hypothetical protein